MPNSFRVRTTLGEDKVLPIKLEQDFDTLEILSLAIFPNDVYTKSCSDFGVICGRVFCNRGLGLTNARVSVFIPIQSEDENNPIISTLYPYKSFADFNEDGYKYNLLPYVQSYSGHVPVGTFPDRIDALTNPSVVEVYDKYYKFTAKTNDSGDFMIFGVPVGQHELFMQVDLSDIGEFSLTPQDLIRMGRATESQVNGTTFKFSENYSELPQIVTLTKTIQVAPFYGDKSICDYYIVRADFDLTTEAAIELKPTAVFMGSLISTNNRKKQKKNCKVPAKQGWLCDLITGPGQIEIVRQTIFTDSTGRPVLEEHKLENDGKLIDENGTWLVELPMNLDYQYTDENGNRKISPDGSVGVPTRAKCRFKIKWQQTTSLNEENRRAYFLVPNVKEYGWDVSYSDSDDPALSNFSTLFYNLNTSTNIVTVSLTSFYSVITTTENVKSYVVLVNGVVSPEYQTTIPLNEFSAGTSVQISYTLIDVNTGDGKIFYNRLNESQFKLQSSYAFSLNWGDYGTSEMIQEAINCEDRFYEFLYNKVYTVSQLIDRYSGGIYPSKAIQIKHITDNKCEGNYNPFPTNDAQYRFDILFILFSLILSIFKYVLIPLVIVLHVLSTLWWVLIPFLAIVGGLWNFVIRPFIIAVYAVARFIGIETKTVPEPIDIGALTGNPFVGIKLPLVLNTEEGCQACKCDLEQMPQADNDATAIMNDALNQIGEGNSSFLGDFPSNISYVPTTTDWRPGSTYITGVLTDDSSAQVTDEPRRGRLTAILCGWNGVYEDGFVQNTNQWTRLPVFNNLQDVYLETLNGGQNISYFSLDLTIAERLNLFNTKAKYFDNMTSPTPGGGSWYNTVDMWPVATQSSWPGGGGDPYNNYSNNVFTPAYFDLQDSTNGADRLALYNSYYLYYPQYSDVSQGVFDAKNTLSPGNTGWNQVKVSWGIDFPANATPGGAYGPYKSHFDNLLVLVMDDAADFQDGDLITFQNPEDSSDPNREATYGVFTVPISVIVNYANPNFVGSPNTLSQTYKIANQVTATTATTCYATDIEYFQVIKTIKYGDYLYHTNIISSAIDNAGFPGGNFPLDENGFQTHPEYAASIKGDFRFSLPFRFLRTNYGTELTWGRPDTSYAVPNTVQYTSAAVSSDYLFSNCQNVYSVTFIGNQSDPYCPLCSRGVTQQANFLDSWKSYQNSKKLKIVFVQRGVDPNSPKIKMRFDLRRYFGCKNSWSEQECRKMNTPSFPGPVSISNGRRIKPDDIWLVEGDYRMNIPIQAGGQVTGQQWETKNSKGLKLPNHNEVTSNEPNPSNTWSNIFFPSYVFTYNLPDNDFDGTWKTKNHLFYSALDKNAKTLAQNWMTISPTSIYPPLNSNNAFDIYDVPNGASYEGVVTNNFQNAFGKRLVKEHARNLWDCENTGSNGNYNGNYKVVCSKSISGRHGIVFSISDSGGFFGGGAYNISDTASNCIGNAIPQGLCCLDGTSSFTLDPGYVDGGGIDFGNASNCLGGAGRYHREVPNYLSNNVGGYWGREYIEGGSFFSMRLKIVSDDMRRDLNCNYGAEQCMYYPRTNGVLTQQKSIFFGSSYYDGSGGYCDDGTLTQSGARGIYVSPVYAAFAEDVPAAAGYNTSTWYVNPNNELTMSNPTRLVFRTDRLPSSDYLRKDANGNAYILHQNSGFKIYRLNECAVEGLGGGDVAFDYPSDTNISDLLGDNEGLNEIAQSLTECQYAVDLNSYGIDANGNPFIHNFGENNTSPYSEKPAAAADYLWFQRGSGCYNLVSKPLVSLFSVSIDPIYNGSVLLEPEKKYNDIRSVVEWIQRLKLTFAQCFDIFSHTFSNNWINGTLYAFSFQNATLFNSLNQPVREYCKNTIYFNPTIKNYFYRCSPWNGSSFIGKAKYDLNSSDTRYGNAKNLLFPTTILDMGPKNRFIQEIVFSDDYDGYVADVIPTTTFQDITTTQNLFVLSRLTNVKFIQLLFPAGNVDDTTGNESGSDDPSIAAFFANRRWQSDSSNENGVIFLNGFVPGLIDGDYSQLISINSELGVVEYSAENYGPSSIFFGLQDDNGFPYYGLFFRSDNQLRDYISPRRTLWNPNATLPLTVYDTTYISTNSQYVPFYQWDLNQSEGNPTANIFATQNNNFEAFIDNYFSQRYQQLDRLNNASSRYYKPDGNNSFYYKGYIYNHDLVNDTPTSFANPINEKIIFGAPNHFYFGLIQGSSAMDRFITKYVDTNIVNE